MESVIAFLLVFFVIAIPFFCLAYAIFLIRENKATRYRAVYARAVVFICIFLLIIGGYFYAPALVARIERPPDLPVEGRYYNSYYGDTLTLANQQVTIRHRKQPVYDLTGTYIITYPNGSGIANDWQVSMNALFGKGGQANQYTRMISFYYSDSSKLREYLAAKSKSKRKSYNTYAPVPVSRATHWWIVVRGNSLSLIEPYNNNGRQFHYTKL